MRIPFKEEEEMRLDQAREMHEMLLLQICLAEFSHFRPHVLYEQNVDCKKNYQQSQNIKHRALTIYL